MSQFAMTIALTILVRVGLLAAADLETTTDDVATKAQPTPKPSFTATDADSAFAAYNKAFYVVKDGKGYYKEETTGGRNHFWTQAEEIEMIVDAWEHSPSTERTTLIRESMNGFVEHFQTNWLSNKYNDDLMWMVIASSRAFLTTTNAAYKSLAKFHFDETYARAWSTNLGGGLWWTTNNNSKNACVNGPAAIAACYLYQILADASYLQKAKAIYTWEREHLFDPSSGAVRDNMRANGRVGGPPLTYNEGTFIGAANFLANFTGDKTYLADAEKAADYTRDRISFARILPGGGGDGAGFNGIFVRWLVRFAKDNHLWPKYHGWMIENANAAWNHRRSDNLSWNRWPVATPEGPLRAWACADTVVILQVVPIELSETTSDPAHLDAKSRKPLPWPNGIIPFDISKLSPDQAKEVKQAMQLWMDTGANIQFIPRTTETAYVHFTGRTNAGNNTTFNGYRKGARLDVNITAFWWRQGPWMPAHELGHALGFHHEHQRWDRDRYVTIHYEHIKPGRESDYNWIPGTNWIVATPNYDYRSIMHYRTCWTSRCESECKDGVGDSPCAVIDPVGTDFDGVIGQWTLNRISQGDAEKLRLVYGLKKGKPPPHQAP